MNTQPTAINLNQDTIKQHDQEQRAKNQTPTEQLIKTLEQQYEQTAENHLTQLRRAIKIIQTLRERTNLQDQLIQQHRQNQQITRNLLREVLNYIDNPRPRNKPLITKAIQHFIDKTTPQTERSEEN